MSTSIEFGTKTAADRLREEQSEHLCSDDDRRLKTVRFDSDTPEGVLAEARLEAAEGRGERSEGAGQVPLSESDKDRIDFSKGRASVPHARSVKGIARSEGVDDWTAYYDPTLTVDEHRDVLEDAATEGGGRRLDEDASATEKAGQAARTAQSEQCDHAEGHCKHGDQEACEFLRDRCGFSDPEVERILQETDLEEADFPGEVWGAIASLWEKYRAGLGNAKEAAAAINEIRTQHDQEPLAFEELGGRRLTKEDITS